MARSRAHVAATAALFACSSACTAADVTCDASSLVDEGDGEWDREPVTVEGGALKLDGTRLKTSEQLRLRLSGLSAIGLSRVESHSELRVQFETNYTEPQPPGVMLPPMTHRVRVEGGLEAAGFGYLTVPIFGCKTQHDLGLDKTCCTPGEEECELEILVSVERADQLYPATTSTFTASAWLEMYACDGSAPKVELLRGEDL